MGQPVIYGEVTKKGENLQLLGDIPALVLWLQDYLNWQEDPKDVNVPKDKAEDHYYEEYSLFYCDSAYQRSTRGYGDDPDMEKFKLERADDIQRIRDFIAALEDPKKHKEWFDGLRRKANGTFYKNATYTLLSLGSFCHYWEDSYKWAGPVIDIKNIDDYSAEIRWDSSGTVEKY